ncbi:MAG: endonuclease domain-containing protein [Marinomonas sp.]|uniref:endonuclease domain-containing protein n=1 Tax=Marinomonas sp. TaxID=1904862 RepID=UPI003F9A19D8
MKDKVFNIKQHKALRKRLRGDMPHPELLLWQRLRGQQLGVKFRRQHGIGSYIVDFYCPEKCLVIELDGDSHYTDKAPNLDKKRDEYLSSKCMLVLRFTNVEVNEELDSVVGKITNAMGVMD